MKNNKKNTKTLVEEKVEFSYVVYDEYSVNTWDFVADFETRKQANEYIKRELKGRGCVKACAAIEVPLCGNEMQYAGTRMQAYRQLKKVVKDWGIMPVL